MVKVELHRHLEGALRFSTLIELAKAAKLQLPFDNMPKLKDALLVTSPMKDLKSVLDKFWTTQSLLNSSEVLERVAYECIEDAHHEGIGVLELRYSLSFVHKNHSQLNYDKIHSSFVKGLQKGMSKFPVKSGLIGIVGRVDTPEIQSRVVDFMVDHSDTFIGIDLADNESDLDSKTLAPLFEKARKAGLRVTIHAGESPGSHNNVRESIDWLNAERIGHGLQIYKFPELIEYVKSKNVHLELCPYSNYLTNAVPSLEKHPFKFLYEQGVSVSINSDDPGIFGSDLAHEYKILRELHGMTQEDFKKINQMALEASFVRT